MLRFAIEAPTAEELGMRRAIRAFLAAELPPEKRTIRGRGFDPGFSAKLGAAGFIGMRVPEEYGGHPASAVARAVVVEELLAARAPISAHWVADRQTAASFLRYGTEEQRRRFLPGICAGTLHTCLGMSEPESGSDLASVRSRATRVDGGWSLSGTKIWTTWARFCHLCVVLCRTSDEERKHDGLTQLVVDLSSDGIDVRPIRTLDGDDEFCEVEYRDVFVPDEMVLGQVGRGWSQITGELVFERSSADRWMSAWGVYQGLVDHVAAHPGERGLEALGRLTAQMRTIRHMSLGVARAFDAGRDPMVEAAAVKDLGTRFEQEAVETVRRIVGADLEFHATDRATHVLGVSVMTSPMFTLRGGTTEILRSILARSLRP